MIDISETLAKASLARAEWPETSARNFFKTVAQALQADIDWDEDAGEQWARFIRGNAVVAMAWVPAPLLLAEAELASDLAVMTVGELLVLIPSLGAAEITADRQRLSDLFGERAHSLAFDSACFSAEDLWYATV